MKKLLFIVSFCMMCSVSSFAFITQSNWRWRNNDGGETSATWRAAQNNSITVGSIDTVLRLRIQFNNNTGETKTTNTSLQYASAPDGPWKYITALKANNAFMMTGINGNLNDQQNSTQQITGSSNAFVPGSVFTKTTETTLTMNTGTTTEFEYCIQPTENISPHTTYYFRVNTNDVTNPLPTLVTTTGINAKTKAVTNGSFENNLQNWTFTTQNGTSATCNITSTDHKEGINAALINVTTAGGTNDIALTHDAFALNVGHTYMVRFWAFAKKQSAGLRLSLKGTQTLNYDYKLYTGWEEYQFAFKAASSSVSLAFLFQKATEYTIDHVELFDENNEGVDVNMNYMWQNKRAEDQYSWLSADGVYSEPLPDGRTVWTCSDGWYGYNDTTTNSMSTHQLLRNTLIVQDAARPDGNLVTKIAGTVDAPQAVMVPPDPQGYDDFFWPRDLTVENDSLKILLPDTRQQNAGDDLTYGLREAIGIFSLPDLSLQRIEWLPYIDTIQYGTLVKADDGYTYAYSKHEIDQYTGHAIVARFPTGHLSANTPWQFLTDTGWSNDYHNSKEIADVELYSVSRLGPNHYVSVFMTPANDKMEAEFAQSPTGPWVGRTIVGQIEGQADIFTYFGVIHEETANNGVYTLSYSNIGDIGQMLDDKTVYWPTFIKADLKSLSPFKDSVLPITLSVFTAEPKDQKVLLQWKTVTETNNDHFEIERSANGTTGWTKIATVKTKGNSLQQQLYNTYDGAPLNGDNYYRLRQVDKDGKMSISSVRLVHMNLQHAVIKVYPNPVKNDLFIHLEDYEGNVLQVQLSDMNGKILLNKTVTVQSSGNYKIPFDTKPAAGIYTLKVNGVNVNETLKVVVQ